MGGAVATKAGVVIEIESKDCKSCTEDVSSVIKVVAEEGTAFGGGVISSYSVFKSVVAKVLSIFEEVTGADTAT